MDKKKSKILYWIMLVISVIGIVIISLKGFNVELKYKTTQQLELAIGKEFKLEEVKEIAKEVLGKNVIIQNVEFYGDVVSITANEINDEQKEQIIDKINEKYSTELSKDDIQVKRIPNIKIREIVIPYIVPLLIISAIFIIYLMIIYYKNGIVKTAVIPAIKIIISQLTLFGVIAITRLPVGRFLPTCVLLVYVLSFSWIIKDLNKVNEQEQE